MSTLEKLRSTYAVKFFTITVCMFLLISAFTLIVADSISSDVRQEELDEIEDKAEIEAAYISQWISGEKKYVNTISQYLPANNTSERIHRLQTVVNDRRTLSEIHVITNTTPYPQTATIIQTTTSANNTSELPITWGELASGENRTFDFNSSDDTFVSWVYVRNATKHIAIATPLHHSDSVLVTEYDISTQITQSVQTQSDTDTVVLGGVSAYVLFSEENKSGFSPYEGRQNATGIGTMIDKRNNTSTVFSGSEVSKQKLRGYHSVTESSVDWVVVEEIPVSEAFSLTQIVERNLVIMLLLMLIGFLGTTAMVHLGPIQSINKLSDRANRITSGETDISPTDSDRTDEIGELHDSFDELNNQLNTVTEQSKRISQLHFDADVMDEELPGELGQALDTMNDELKRYVSELNTERKNYSSLIEQSLEGIALIQNGRFILVNNMFTSISGYTKEELYDKTPSELFFEYNNTYIIEDIRDIQRTESSKETTEQKRVKLLSKTGEYRIVETSAVKTEHDGLTSVLLTMRDITDREQQEKRLQVFNRVLRHNLRTDLQVISGILDVVRTGEHTDEDIDLAQQHADNLLNSANMARQIEESLDEYSINNTSTADILDEIETRVSQQHPDKTIELPTDHEQIRVSTHFHEAVYQVIDNVFSHTDCEKCTINVQEIDTEDNHIDGVSVSVTDTGHGISKHEQDPVFNGTETDLEHASGLGLWFVKWTINIVGGELRIESGHWGTTVKMIVPKATEPTT